MSVTLQTTVPHPCPERPSLVIVGSAPVGRLYACRRCGREVWSYFGRARHHARYCHSMRWVGGRP